MRLPSALAVFLSIAAASLAASEVGPTTDIYWIDVEGGAATLIVTPARESILIDSGENKSLHADRIASVLTKAAKLSKIDYFVISHWHADHYGGTYELTRRVPINRYFANTAPPNAVDDDPAFPVLMPTYRKANSGPTRVLHPGAAIALKQTPGLPPISLRSLASGRNMVAPPRGAASNPLCGKPVTAPGLDDGENAKSLVLLLEYGNFRFLDAGDLTWHIEERLACPVNLVGEVDLYQITHHGLDRSNNPHLVHAIRPRVVVVNNGAQKGAEPKSMQTVLSAPGLEAAWQLYGNPRTSAKLNAPAKRIANPAGGAGNYLKASIRSDGSFSIQVANTDGYIEHYKTSVSSIRKKP